MDKENYIFCPNCHCPNGIPVCESCQHEIGAKLCKCNGCGETFQSVIKFSDSVIKFESMCNECLLKNKQNPKIKKVVIPETEVKMVCTLTEEQFNLWVDEKYSKYAASHYYNRIETPKPLADDEVSVEDIDTRTIHAFKKESEIYILILDDCWFFSNLKSNNSDQLFEEEKASESVKLAIKSGYTVYRFQDQETLFQWCLDQARRAKGE